MLNPADDAFMSHLERLLPGVVSPVTPAYLEEPRGAFKGIGGGLARPKTVQDVSAVVTACAEAKIGIVPFGGGTGLVGGQVQSGGPAPLVLSLERMSRVRGFDPVGNTIAVEAGATLAQVQDAAAAEGQMFPLSLASEGTCRIGGNLATNAGGVQVLRYGNARDLCLGIEAVLPDGSVHHGMKRLRKDNTGFDLRNLLIGSEGTLGVITAAVLKIVPKPVEMTTCFGVVRDPAAAQNLLARMQKNLDGLVSAFELIHGTGFDFLTETMPDVRLPFDGQSEWMVLAEAGGGTGSELDARMSAILERALEDGILSDVLIAQSQAQRDAFWTVRESIPAANKRVGAIASHDISIPLDRIAEFIDDGRDVVAKFGDVRLNCFGHKRRWGAGVAIWERGGSRSHACEGAGCRRC